MRKNCRTELAMQTEQLLFQEHLYQGSGGGGAGAFVPGTPSSGAASHYHHPLVTPNSDSRVLFNSSATSQLVLERRVPEIGANYATVGTSPTPSPPNHENSNNNNSSGGGALFRSRENEEETKHQANRQM